MSMHRSLKFKPEALAAHRNVLSRAERVEYLRSEGRFEDNQSPLGLAKVANRKIVTGKKKKKAEGEEDEKA